MRIGTILSFVLASAVSVTALAQEAGKAVFEKNCVTCHAQDGKGNAAKAKVLKIDPALLNLGRDEVAKQTRDEKKAITEKGKAKMPKYGQKLTPAELDGVTDYTMKLIATIRGGK